MPETALITGASSGIGEAFARALSARGHELVLLARRADRLERLAEELPSTAHPLPCDLGTQAAEVPERVRELGIEIDLLVNNAGFGSHGRFAELDPEREAEMVRVNCEAVVRLTRAFLPSMLERRRGGVITVASTSGMQPLPYTTTYAATKAFALRFSEALSEELRGTGVRCLAVNPGPVPTEWQQVANFETTDKVPGEISPAQVAEESLRAYGRGRRSVIPGRTIRWFMRATKVGPRPIQLRISERMYRPPDGRASERR